MSQQVSYLYIQLWPSSTACNNDTSKTPMIKLNANTVFCRQRMEYLKTFELSMKNIKN